MVTIHVETDGAQAQPDKLLGSYIAVALLGVITIVAVTHHFKIHMCDKQMFLWDVLTNLSSEYELLLKRKIGFPTLVYLWARINSLVGLTLIALVFAAPIGKFCSIFIQISLAGLPPFIGSESLLLFFRLRAVYLDNKRVVRAFLVSLIVIVGCSLSLPFVGEAHQIGPTNAYCTATLNTKLAEAMLIIPLANHIAVFLAISYRLLPRPDDMEAPNSEQTASSQLKSLFRGGRLRGVSRTLVIDGQNYILVFLLTTMLTAAAIGIGGLSDTYRFVLAALHLAVENSMNCYLFRSIRAKTTVTVVTESTIMVNFRQAESALPQSATV